MGIIPTHLNKFYQKTLFPKQFLSLAHEDKINISHTEIIPPCLGQNHFGKIKVHYKRPVYKRKEYFSSCSTDLIF